MAAPTTVCLFIPDEVINEISPSSYILGYWVASEKIILINCTTAVARINEIFDRNVFTFLSSTSEQQTNMELLGLIYSSHSRERFSDEILSKNKCDVNFIIRIDEVLRSFHVDKMCVKNFDIIDVQIIIYDGHGVANSQLLLLNKTVSDVKSSNKTFIAFLSQTCRESERNADILASHECLNSFKVLNFVQTAKSKHFKIVDHILIFVLWMIAVFYRMAFTLFNWCPLWMKNVMLLTALGQQFNQRYIHFSILFENFKEKYIINLKCKNLISAIILDLMFGCLVTFALLNTDIPNFMLNTVISKTNDIVSGLQNLIYWLMGVPAGLKLNIPLNSVLGKFFLYHIYLWESYIMVVQPLFSFILKLSTVIGIFGLTFVLSLLNDLISLATIHIYCFYGYATRLYGYQVTSLVALWRLFRGKKWNPLRQRIDSYTYNVHQLYLGTLIFTVLLFLLPTVMVYYFVFTCLRILVLIIQGLMSRIINILTICPLYSITSRILNSPETTGDVYFTKLHSDGVFTLSMQTSQIPIGKVIQLTLPDLKKYYEVLMWKEFLSCIIWGKIVYPL